MTIGGEIIFRECVLIRECVLHVLDHKLIELVKLVILNIIFGRPKLETNVVLTVFDADEST